MKASSRLLCIFLAFLSLFYLLPLSVQEHEASDVSLGGVPLAYFRIVYRDKDDLPHAQQLQRISYGKPDNAFLTPYQAMEIQDAIRDACKIKPYIMVRCSLGETEAIYTDLDCGAPGTFAIQLGGDYVPRLDYSDGTAPYLRKCTFAAWTIGTGNSHNDYSDNWKVLADQGVRLIMTNDPMGMVRFAAGYHAS